VRQSTMTSLANDLDGKAICGSKPLPLIDPYLTNGQERKNMGSEDRIDLGILQDPLLLLTLEILYWL
jgi:hypothetical protein